MADAKKIKKETVEMSKEDVQMKKIEAGAKKFAIIRNIVGTDADRHRQILLDMQKEGMDPDIAAYLMSKGKGPAADEHVSLLIFLTAAAHSTIFLFDLICSYMSMLIEIYAPII